MTTAVLAVLACGVPGRLAEFRQWYDQVHIPELRTRYREILDVERHDVARSSRTGNCGRAGPDSVAIYLVHGSAADLWSRMSRDRSLTRSDAIDYPSVRALGGSD